MLAPRPVRATGFTLLPVILAMSLIAAIAFLLNRDNGVNARMIANRSDLDRARYAAEAGLQAVNFVVQAAGCAGTNYPISSSPVTNINFGGAAYSAYASKNQLLGGTPAPPISFITSTGSYNGASVTLTRNNVYVYQSPSTTVVVRPGESLQPTRQDTFLSIVNPDRNYGGVTPLRLYTGNYQPLLKFDLSAFPTGSRAIPWYDNTQFKLQPGATLSLYQSSNTPSPGASVNAQLITQSWMTGTGTGSLPTSPPLIGATWNTYDGTHAWPSPGVGYAPAPVASTPYPNAPGWAPSWVNWDLTNAASWWMSGYPNNGIWLVDSGASVGNTSYVSSDDTNTALHPTLTLNTLLPCGATAPPSANTGSTATPPTTVTLGAAEDTYITADTTNGAYILNYGKDTTMYVGEVQTSPNLEQRLLLKFDASGIPPGSVITSATLRLTLNKIMSGSAANSTKSLDAYALTQSFVEGTSSLVNSCPTGASWTNRDCGVGWTTRGGTYDATTKYATGRVESSGASPLPGSFVSGWVTWDLTALAQGWVDGVIVNNGFLVKSNATDQTYSLQFLTKENNSSGGKYSPQLVVVYQ
jgi:hypothetical protein